MWFQRYESQYSFINLLTCYQMGTTGSSETGKINNELPEIISRIREYTDIPLAVGFGVATRAHFETVADAGADGVVIGSRLVQVIKNAPSIEIARHVEAYCHEISKGNSSYTRTLSPIASPSQKTPPSAISSEANVLPQRFGQFGGQYVPESLVDCLAELEVAHKSAMGDPEFQKEFKSYFGYINRPSRLYFAENLTKDAGGANIWLKREDLNHTGSHKINNAIGQVNPTNSDLATGDLHYCDRSSLLVD